MRKLTLDYEKNHYNRMELVEKQINQLYFDAIDQAVNTTIGLSYNSTKTFYFKDYPQTKKRIDNALLGLNENINLVLGSATAKEWAYSNAKNDALVEDFTKRINLDPETKKAYMSRNEQALQAFQSRKVNGLNLSDRVWKYTNQFKGDIEMAFDIGLGDGRSAAELSRDVRSYLQEPDKLFRRVRDKHGELRLSQNAKQYSPGTGTYRSSYKNAMRLARTEVNMAYRTADFERINELDFVVGIEIKRSGRLSTCEVCESLKGKYPKAFKFVGWHSQCRCFTVSVLSSEDEFIAQQKRLMNGDDRDFTSKNQVSEVPDNFNQWVSDNEERISKAKNLPYFMKDNKRLI